MPSPRRGEREDHYVSRCIPVVLKEGTVEDSAQAAAVCHSMFRESKKRRKKSVLAPRQFSPFSYEIKSKGISALDSLSTNEPSLDKSKMSIQGILASTLRDREGDVFEVEGLDLSNHRLNPIALLDHGIYHPLPIGKTMTPEGEYTVEIIPELGEIHDEIFLSQSCPVAEQVFHLYDEGILRAQSIGFRPIASQRLPADPERGLPQGKHILRSELIEATICGIPANPDAVQRTLSLGRIEGRPLEYAIKSMLRPYAPARKVWSPGASLEIHSVGENESTKGKSPMVKSKNTTSEGQEPMSAIDESRGGALRGDSKKRKALPQNSADLPPDAPREQEFPEDDRPLGHSLLDDLCYDLQDIHSQYRSIHPKVENVKVSKMVGKILDDLSEKAAACEDMMKSEYGSERPDEDGDIKDLPKDTEEESPDSPGEGGDAEGEENEVEGKRKSFRRKRFTKSQSSLISDCKEMLKEMEGMEGMSKTQKMALKYMMRMMDEMESKDHPGDTEMGPMEEDGVSGVGEETELSRHKSYDPGEQLTPEEKREYARLERAIARRERQLIKMGL